MNVDQVTTIFALLAIVAALIAAANVVALVASRTSGELGARIRSVRETQWINLVLLGSIIAFVAMAGSLYLSEVAHFTPCAMCIRQRWAMYPLGPILLIGFVVRRGVIKLIGLPIALIGLALSTYHILIEQFPDTFETSKICSLKVPCSVSPVTLFGFITVPTMAWCGFAAIATSLALVPRSARRPVDDDEPDAPNHADDQHADTPAPSDV